MTADTPSGDPASATPTESTAATEHPDPAGVAALVTMLTATHAAVYATAAAGGAVAPLGPAAAQARELARLSCLAHQALRDDLIAAIRARGGDAPPALPAYRLPVAPEGIGAALALLARIEDACAMAAHDAVAVLVGDVRALALDALTGTAVRAQRARIAAGMPLAAASRALPGT
ncbi:DUF4439 domain-containing protein [Frankia sp. CgMI4]|uniref:DUF4439 domain-containing protein n=1 Tax=Frankia sp. CgMI4 TaxID=1742262 RepID=UPI000B092509|nr:DUF4439 domain-containing protein [Frankia sp. CgIM4]